MKSPGRALLITTAPRVARGTIPPRVLTAGFPPPALGLEPGGEVAIARIHSASSPAALGLRLLSHAVMGNGLRA